MSYSGKIFILEKKMKTIISYEILGGEKMFADAIEKCSNYTRSIHFISRRFGNTEVVPGTATLFFVNEDAVAITCKHVAEELLKCNSINDTYEKYKRDIENIPGDMDENTYINGISNQYGYHGKITAELKTLFYDCVKTDEDAIKFSVIKHKEYDLAIIKINNAKTNCYTGHAVFAKDSNELRRGDFLCRIGYPFPEFKNYEYDSMNDTINWTSTGRNSTPLFPIEGMLTRNVTDAGKMYEYELSTPGLKGQSGGPLFDKNGLVYGVQAETVFLHLGFDQYNAKVRIDGEYKCVDNHPFLHVGRCICVDVIKAFLNENNIKYYVADNQGDEEIVNG